MFSFRLSAAFFFLSVLPACAPMIDTHGDALDAEALASLQPEKTSYADVLRIIGSPSARAVFDSEDWIYIRSRQERMAFFKPKEIERTVTVLTFDRDGILQKIETKTLADGREFTPSDAKTEMNEKSMTILEQMISNVGHMGTDAPVH